MSRPSRKIIIEESTGRRLIEQSRVRLLCVGLFFLLCFGSIIFRMLEVAVLDNRSSQTITVSDPDNEEKSEQVEIGIEPAERTLRGDIVDRNGILLATSLMTASVFADPREIRNPDEVAKKLAKALNLDAVQLQARLKSKKSFVWIKRNLPPREQQTANSLGIPGVYFLPEEKRVYPYDNLLSHVLGYVGIDDKGLAGLEKQFDQRLRDTALSREPLALSIDLRLQSVMREEMKKAMEAFEAVGAVGAILDLQSGELLSMVSLPDFNPNQPGSASDNAKFNRATLGVYEMGSTFKSFTMAMALDFGTASMKSGYDATNPFKVAAFTIQDTHPQKRFLTLPEIFAFSSNIGSAKAALDIGSKRQKQFLENIGMMQPVDIELPERGSPLYPTNWREINTVTISYGHGMSVTPLHLIRGIAAIVGDGTVPRLTLIKDGNRDKAKGQVVVGEQTVRNMRRLMRLVVDHGTGSKADVPGYRVGGKTGTAEKIGGSGYDADAKLASFIAAFPVDKPRYIVLVMIDEPKGNKETYGYATGGWISAPVVGSVISRMGPMLGIKPAFDVPADDAEKYWVYNKPRDKPAVTNAAAKQYFHAASY